MDQNNTMACGSYVTHSYHITALSHSYESVGEFKTRVQCCLNKENLSIHKMLEKNPGEVRLVTNCNTQSYLPLECLAHGDRTQSK